MVTKHYAHSGGYETKYAVHLRLTGKPTVDYILVTIEFFH